MKKYKSLFTDNLKFKNFMTVKSSTKVFTYAKLSNEYFPIFSQIRSRNTRTSQIRLRGGNI